MKTVGILGATGAVGMEFLEALQGHPSFTVARLYASEKNVNKPLKDATRLDVAALSDHVKNMVVSHVYDFDARGLDLVCSALPSSIAREVEPQYAQRVPVISNSSAFRYESDVPILITEVNAEHAELLLQQRKRAWKGWLAPQPNCTTVGLAVSLKPLLDAFGLAQVVMTSYQAVSGGGYELIERWRREREALGGKLPLPAERLVEKPETTLEGNVIGLIADEEPKVKRETLKILGQYRDGQVVPAQFALDCFCVRVPTFEGHLEAVFVETIKACHPSDVLEAVAEFNARSWQLYGHLPSSPEKAITVLDRVPQPRFDAELDRGMTTVMGRIEKCDLGPRWLKYFVLSNNVKKGAARGSLQVLEYLEQTRGYL